jgi:predicted CXXCH cytochrome family protein
MKPARRYLRDLRLGRLGRLGAVVAALAIAACAGVLGLTGSGPQPFPHRKHTISGIACTRCHAKIETDAGAGLHIPDESLCVTCHKKPHDPSPCLTCHAAANALAELQDARDHMTFEHKRHVGPARGNCMRCHTGIAEGDTHIRPPMAICFTCHDHDAQSDARKCDACHKNLEDTKLQPASHLAHDGDWLREHGSRAASSGDLCQTCHRERFCAQCHGKTVAALPATMHFADPFAPSVHRANFFARHNLEARAEPGLCSTCHSPDRCVACHVARGVGADGTRKSPHPIGWVGPGAADTAHGREARRDPAACAACHDGAGQMLCVGCHKVGGVGGSVHPPGWSSRLPLSAVPCRLCHPLGSKV